MLVAWTRRCPNCQREFLVRSCRPDNPCPGCGRVEEVTLRRQTAATVHPRERAVVWSHPGTGEIRYPGRNDVSMPERYRRAGYVRRELSSLREVEKFERDQGVHNEAAWYDRGSGRGFEDEYSPPEKAPGISIRPIPASDPRLKLKRG